MNCKHVITFSNFLLVSMTKLLLAISNKKNQLHDFGHHYLHIFIHVLLNPLVCTCFLELTHLYLFVLYHAHLNLLVLVSCTFELACLHFTLSWFCFSKLRVSDTIENVPNLCCYNGLNFNHLNLSILTHNFNDSIKSWVSGSTNNGLE